MSRKIGEIIHEVIEKLQADLRKQERSVPSDWVVGYQHGIEHAVRALEQVDTTE